MKTIHVRQPQDVVALLSRRKWWVVGPFVTLSCAIILLTYILPRTYVSSSLIVIQPRDVPKDFVKDLITGTTEDRLRAIEQTVLSRTNLQEVLSQFGDELTDYKSLNEEQKVDKLRARIEVEFDGQKSVGNGVAYFHVKFQSQDPALAQKITSKLTSLFIEQDKSARQTLVSGTTTFLATEVQKAEDALRLSDMKLKQLKEKEGSHLPDQLASNRMQMDRLATDLRSSRDSLDRMSSQRMSLQQLIATTPQTIARQTSVGAVAPPKRIPNPKVEEYRRLNAQYEEARARYTDGFSEVIGLKLRLDRLKDEIPAQDFETVMEVPTEPTVITETTPNPAYETLTASLLQLDTEMRIRSGGAKETESQLSTYSQRVEATAATEQRLKDVMRENEDLNRQHQDLKNKLFDAKQSETLESGQQGSQFDIVDPANYPLAPVKPVRSVIILVGMGISFVVGLVFALAAELSSQRIWSQSELEALIGVPILAEIPRITTGADLSLARKKKITVAATSVAFASAYSVALYFVYIYQASVLKGLDPLIQKLVY